MPGNPRQPQLRSSHRTRKAARGNVLVFWNISPGGKPELPVEPVGVSPLHNVPYSRPGIGQGGCCRPQALPPGGGVGETRAPPAVEPVGGTESARSPDRRCRPQSNRWGWRGVVCFFVEGLRSGRVLSMRRIRGWVGAEPRRPRATARGYPNPQLRSSIRMARRWRLAG